MKKLKLFLMAFLAMGALGQLRAQTDVTSTYITNPSFEADGAKTASNGALTITGWTQSDPGTQFNNTGTYNSSTAIPTQGSDITVTPTAGDYFLFFRRGWAKGSTYTFTSSSASTLPAGAYTLSVDYKMAGSYDNSETSTTAIAISAKNGDTVLGTGSGTTRQTYSGGSTAFSYLNTADWSTATATFTIEEETSTNFVISLTVGDTRRSDFVIDNVKLLYDAFVSPTAVTLSESNLTLNPTATSTLTATITPSDANYQTDITWTTSDATVATVANGVVTAVGPGSATITATTANSVSATCSVTVTDVTPAAAPSFYSEIAAGDFYIVNAATGKYLGGANSWGTQASQIEHGIPFTVAISDGKYTLDSHTYNNETDHFFSGTYVDGASTNLYITSLGSGKYSISTADGSAFVTANVNDNVVANTAPTANSVLAQWYFVSKADREALLASATDAAPVDATYYLTEANISRNLRKAYNTSGWTGTFSYGGANENQCAERYCATTDVYQTVTVPNGKYTVSCQGFYRRQSAEATSYLYANNEQVALNRIEFGGINSMDGASTAFTNGEYNNTLTVYVTDGTLKVGIKCDATTNWTIWDNFTISYHGPTIGGKAEELPASDMTAGNWYYFDIAIDGDYNLTTTTLSDIVYTTDGTILIENENSVTTNFGTNPVALTAGRYYVKSSSAQTLVFAPASYDYEIGSPTLSVADDGYTQSSTFTVTFPDAATNDPDGETSFVASSKATVNGNEVTLAAVTNGFSLDLGSLTANTDYNIVIPANVYGYTGESMNAAIDITIHTPVVFDGFYFLRTSTGKYVARGGDYNSRAVVDEFGLPLSVATDASGITQFTYVDNGGKLFLNGSGNAYTDNNTDPDWTFEATEGGYYLVHANGDYANKKLNIWTDNALFATTTEGAVFVIEPVSEHNNYMEALKDAQAATAATAAGIAGITTKADLATWLDDNFNANSVSVTAVSFTEKWNGDASAEWGAGKDMYTNTITDLPAGLYKLTVNAYYRINGSATAADGARGNTYLYGGSAKTQLYSLKDFPAAEAWSGRNQSDAAGYYPDDATSGAAATASSYLTELYVYHDGGDFTYGIHQPSRFSNGEWFGYQNFTLTSYQDKALTLDESVAWTPTAYTSANVTLTRSFNSNWATFVVPFDIDNATLKAQFGDDVQVSTISATDTEGVQFTAMAEPAITANEPVIMKVSNTEGTYTFNNVEVKAASATKKLVTGVSVIGNYDGQITMPASDDSNKYYYIASNKMKYTTGTQTLKGFRAYFSVAASASESVKSFFESFNAGGEDAINGIEAEAENGNIFNLAGQRVNKAQKGIYIVNGKKVIVK